MVNIRPMKIPGRWADGFALDFHTVSSTYLGDDEYGRPVFDTKRTELGDLLFRLKYRSDRTVVGELVETIANFVDSWSPGATIILPVPSSRPAVLTVAEALGKRLSIPVRPDAVNRAKDLPEIKNVYDYDERLRLLQGAHSVDVSIVSGRKVLLFDDLFRSGATMNSITEALYQEGHVAEVYALAITRTRSRS